MHGTGKLRFVEVKCGIVGADTIAVTCNEILHSLNKPDNFVLANVEFIPKARIVFTTGASPFGATQIFARRA